MKVDFSKGKIYKVVNDYNDDINDVLVAKRLKRAQRLVLEGADVDWGSNYVDIETGDNRCLAFYFDEVKN